ncbi:hypothetical protein E8E11_006201 [Didymella keratinophila]|nr:hypothetical protein E8E11_006201 [Didymella keratinophila]
MVPPEGAHEYECNPFGPPDQWPPVCPAFILHMLHAPQIITVNDGSILGQLPKKVNHMLEEGDGPPPAGWGLYSKENRDPSVIIGIVFILLFLTSPVFLIIWAIKHSKQILPTIAGYILAAAAMFGAWMGMKNKSVE